MNENCIVFPRVEVTYIALQSYVDLFHARARVSPRGKYTTLTHKGHGGILDRASRRDRSPLFFNNNCSGIVDRRYQGGGRHVRGRDHALSRPMYRRRARKNRLRRNTKSRTSEWIGPVSISALSFFFLLNRTNTRLQR